MEILCRLDALLQPEGDVHRLLASISEIYRYTLNSKFWIGEAKFIFVFCFFLTFLFLLPRKKFTNFEQEAFLFCLVKITQ